MVSSRQVATIRRATCRSVRTAILLAAACVAQSSYAQSDAPWELWTVNADGTGRARFAETPGYSCGSPQWSPDGTMVAYDTRRVDEDLLASKVAVIRADGSGSRLLGPGSMPNWSPDGTHLVFHTYEPRAIVVMNADGTGRETVTDHWGSPRWMPDGNRIASIGANGGIAVFDLATGRERDVLSGPYSLRPGIAVSPNCRRICFGDSGGGLFLATFDARMRQTSVQSIVQRYPSYHVAWSPDGRQIVFSWRRSNNWAKPTEILLGLMSVGSIRPAFDDWSQLYLWQVDSNEPPRRLPGQGNWRNNVNPGWSPDGKSIIFASQRPSASYL